MISAILTNVVSLFYPPDSLEPEPIARSEGSAYHDKIYSVFLQAYSQPRVESSVEPPLEYTVVLRQARSWKTVDEMLDRVAMTDDNQTWKLTARKIGAMMLLYGQKLKNREGDAATISKEIELCAKEIDTLTAGYIPQDCEQIAWYIEIHKHSLLLFAHMNEVRPLDDAIFIEVLSSNAKTPFLPETIRGTYHVREVEVEEVVDKNISTFVYKQPKSIAFIGNKLTYPACVFSLDELENLYNMYSIVYSALNSAIDATNKELSINRPLA